MTALACSQMEEKLADVGEADYSGCTLGSSA